MMEKMYTDLQSEAIGCLYQTDQMILRCVEDDIPVPEEIVMYRKSLRRIASGLPGPLPKKPDYPT
jgi:hypothetical protein